MGRDVPGGQRGPIWSMLDRYAGENALRFHMPGHKGLTGLPGANHDLTEIPGSDSLFDPKDGILQAQEEAARCWRAGRSFLLVNGSTSGVHAMILWAKSQGLGIVLPRDCHISAIYACALSDLQPVWMRPTWIAPEQLVKQGGGGFPTLPDNGRYAVFATYPDYYGRCVNLEALRDKANSFNGALLVDSAHGAHFAFNDRLPPDAGNYADLWVTGAHKTLPAPTQTAFLHLKDKENETEVSRLLRGVTTTSPSYLLMEGLDDGREYMQSHAERLDELIDNCAALSDRLNGIDGLRCWNESDAFSMGYWAYDSTRIVVDVRGLGMSGWEAGARLRDLGLQAEMCDIYRVVLIVSVMDGRDRLDGAFDAFARLSLMKKAAPFSLSMDSLPECGQTAMTPRQAWFSRTEGVVVKDAAGRVASEPFGAYPPGIPLCMPGEVITKDIITSVQQAQALGGKFFGVREGKISVVK